VNTATGGAAGRAPQEGSPPHAVQAGGLTIRPGTPEDVPRIVELLRISLGEGKIPRQGAYWRWKHVDNPFGESPVLLAESEGQLAGLRAFMRWNWRVGKHFARSVRAVDTATHPDWQGKGIFTRLTKALLDQMTDEGVHFVFNTPNEKSRPGYLKMGWRQVGRMDLLIRPVHPLRLGRALFTGRADSRGEPPEAPDPSPSKALPLAKILTSRGFGEFLAKVGEGSLEGRMETVKTVEYLRWRYHAIPEFNYSVVGDFDEQGGAAVVFRYKTVRGLRELRICEFLLDHSTASISRATSLLSHLLKDGGSDYISAMAAPGDATRAVLIRCGFIPAFRLGPILTVRPLNALPACRDATRRDTWRFSIGDLELF